MDDLQRLRRDYLDDVHAAVGSIRTEGLRLAEEGEFKNAFPALLFLAHQLKGSGGSLGFPGITEIAREIGRRLNLFLDDEQTDRPTPAELSQSLLALSSELEREVASARESLP